jgi:hypothetical protein
VSPADIGELSVAGAAIIIAWKVIDWTITLVQRKNGKNNKEGNRSLQLSSLPCAANPVFMEQFKEMKNNVEDVHRYTQDNRETMASVRSNVASGGFSCAWKGRDEIRDFFSALNDLTNVVKGLTKEMQRANNGGSKK